MRLSTLSRSQQKKGLLSHISDPRIVPRQRVLRLEGRIGLSMKHLKSNTASFPTLLYTIRFVWQEHKSYPDQGHIPGRINQNRSIIVLLSSLCHVRVGWRVYTRHCRSVFIFQPLPSYPAMPCPDRRRVLAQPRPNAAPPPL